MDPTPMMPQNHFAVAAVVTVAAVLLFYPDVGRWEAVAWVVVSGTVAALIDLDVILLVRWRARDDPGLRPYTNMRTVSKDLRAMLVLLQRKGLLTKVAVSHLVSATVLTVASYLLASSYLVPVFIGAWSHLVSDVPYVRSVVKEAASN